METDKSARHMTRPYGGLRFLDKVNLDLLTLDPSRTYNDSLHLGGVEWTFLGRGCDRTVYRHGTLVLKVPNIDPDDTFIRQDANEKEFKVFQKARAEGAEGYFAKAIALLDEWPYGAVLVMEYIEGELIFKELGYTKSDKKLHTMSMRIERKSSSSLRVYDLHGANVIGRKAIDYGRFAINH